MGYGINMAKGLLVTLKNLTKKPFTVEYPESRVKAGKTLPALTGKKQENKRSPMW